MLTKKIIASLKKQLQPMKKIFLLSFVLLGFLSLKAQDTIPPYKKYDGIPSFKVMRPDSSFFTTADVPQGKPFVIVYFSPTCSHCQKTANEYVARMDEMKDVFFLWVCYHSPDDMSTFAKDYNLANRSNVVIAKDVDYFFPPYYKIQSTPCIIAFDKNGKTLSVYYGGTDPENIINLYKHY